ncbi:MAG: hypothetical protein L6R39_002227 [Caloplaca ligustica]|nr:MAG: hypothetical protein L6R39_002227 [Caloplaca ligustica]
MSATLFGLSIREGDGMALLATVLLSFLSTLVGFGSRWELVLPRRVSTRQVPQSDVVIKYPNGAFLIVKCNEEVARALYWHPERCKYKRPATSYRLISLTGTLVLMFGVICLGNATLNLQLGFAASYIILNAAYWVVAALPQQWNWDLGCYKKEKVVYCGGEHSKNYTTALWKAIAISGTTNWVRLAPDIAPTTKQWNLWLEEAARVIDAQPCIRDEMTGEYIFPPWDPERYLDKVLASDGALNDEAQIPEDFMV